MTKENRLKAYKFYVESGNQEMVKYYEEKWPELKGELEEISKEKEEQTKSKKKK